MGAWLTGQAQALGLGAIPRGRRDVEALVGRYGTVAVAALLILAGVGALLTWAIEYVTIGPEARVGLGLAAALTLGGLGWRIRTRAAGADALPGGMRSAAGGRRYGDVLLALALAIVHVDAWGAGPYLGLIAPSVALGIAAAASGALALLAWRERDQPLFVVGVGGALVAPFVTSAGPGHPFVLPIYGWLVLTSGALALPRAERWTFAGRMLGIAGSLYAGSMLAAAASATRPLDAQVPALFALAAAVGALVTGGPVAAGWLSIAHATTTTGAVMALALDATNGVPRLALVAAVTTVVAYAALLRVAPDRRAQATALLLPLLSLVAALLTLAEPASTLGAAVCAAWAALALSAGLVSHALRARRAAAPTPTRDPDDMLLGAHVTVVGFASALGVAILSRTMPVALVVALAAHVALFAGVFTRVRRRVAMVAPLLVAVAASAAAYVTLSERAAYAYTPFLTRESLGAACAVAAWVALAWCARQAARRSTPREDVPALSRGERSALVATAAAAAVGWGREELARAGSAEVATFLLVGYFAAVGLVAIQVGRARRVAAARQAGLALALYAAFKAFAQASQLASVGLRVGSYLLVGVFLLGVGWWYRAAGDDRDEGDDQVVKSM